MDKKIKIAIIIFSLLVLGLLAYLAWPKKDLAGNPAVIAPAEINSPIFMSDQDKKDFNLPAETKVQIIGRDEKGGINVYRIIYSDADVIADPSKIGPSSPRL